MDKACNELQGFIDGPLPSFALDVWQSEFLWSFQGPTPGWFVVNRGNEGHYINFNTKASTYEKLQQLVVWYWWYSWTSLPIFTTSWNTCISQEACQALISQWKWSLITIYGCSSMIWNSHGSWESDILWQLHSQKATLHEALLWLQLWTFQLLNIHLSLQIIQLIFIAPFVSVVRDQLLVESIIIFGSYEMMKRFINTQKNGGMWWPWRMVNTFLTNMALITLSCGNCHTGNQLAD